MQVLRKVANIVSSLLFLAAGITVLILRHINAEYNAQLLGAILLVSGFAELLIYAFHYAPREPSNMFVVAGGVKVAFGFIFLFTSRDMDALCFAWGIADILIAVTEIIGISKEVRHHPFKSFEIAIAIGDLVFGIILCIKLSHGLTGHLIFLGISLILYSLILIGEFTEEYAKRRR